MRPKSIQLGSVSANNTSGGGGTIDAFIERLTAQLSVPVQQAISRKMYSGERAASRKYRQMGLTFVVIFYILLFVP